MTGMLPLRLDSVEHDLRDEARAAAIEAAECRVCGSRNDGLTDGECDECWLAADLDYERRIDN